MRILALEPYYGGSHKNFIDNLSARSRHQWDVLTLAAHKWKWRMRHSAITFAEQVREKIAVGNRYDVIFCSDMLNLAEFIGLAGPEIVAIPKVAYFHENQLTYPVRCEDERDFQFAVTNMTTCIAAEQVWFNSAFNRDSFLDALKTLLNKMPDNQPFLALEDIRRKSHIKPPGIKDIEFTTKESNGPIRILWVARWEHDKNPEEFFEAMNIVEQDGMDFRLSVIGESFRNVPPVFDWARQHFAEHIDRWGYQKQRRAYEQALAEADVVVSTAMHEFFGLSVIEAIAAGAYPLLPKRLSYPELLRLNEKNGSECFFYSGGAKALAEKIKELIAHPGRSSLTRRRKLAAKLIERFKWKNLIAEYDREFEQIA